MSHVLILGGGGDDLSDSPTPVRRRKSTTTTPPAKGCRISVLTRNAGYSRKPDKQLVLNTNQGALTSEND